MKGKYYVYKFEDKNGGVLYVGKSKDIEQRIATHLREKEWIEEGYKIYIAETSNQVSMDIYELYYINRLNPIHNVMNVYNEEFSSVLPSLDFKFYKEITKSDTQYKTDIKQNKINKLGLSFQELVYLDESIKWDVKNFLYETKIAINCELNWLSSPELESIHYRFNLKPNVYSNIYIQYAPDELIDIPSSIYKQVMLPMLKQDLLATSVYENKHYIDLNSVI